MKTKSIISYKSWKTMVMLAVGLFLSLSLFGCAAPQANQSQNKPLEEKKIGISWKTDVDSKRDSFVYNALKEAGVTPVYLDQVIDYDLAYDGTTLSKSCQTDLGYINEDSASTIKTNTYKNSNVKDVLKDIDGVVFTGGEDVSPSLYKDPKGLEAPQAELDFNSTRDVSDYLLMSYCIDQDINSFGICRGMQILAVVSGAEMIQDIPTYFKQQNLVYNNEHRNTVITASGLKQYAKHDVDVIDKDSFLYKFFKQDVIKDVPSVHHQAIKSVDGTNLKVVGITPTNGVDIVEALQRTDKQHISGVQFHPEAAIAKNLANEEIASLYMNKDIAVEMFKKNYE